MNNAEALRLARDALVYMQSEKIDYMLRNKLGDPSKETATKLANAAIAAIDALAQPQPSAPSVEPAPTRADLIAALTFYADGLHFDRAAPAEWDTVSDEPQNWWCDAEGTATVEDGYIAKATLSGQLTAGQINEMEDGESLYSDDIGAAPLMANGLTEAESAQRDEAERYCLFCDKAGHQTHECHSTHGLNTPADRELYRLVCAASQAATASVAGISKLDPNEDDPGRLWAEIARLCAALKGPDGYATWQDAATAERVLRVKAERAAPQAAPVSARIDSMQNPLRPIDWNPYPDETPAEQVLRKLACWLGVGGYNALTVDADLFHRKIVDGVQMMLTACTAPPAPAAVPAAQEPIQVEAVAEVREDDDGLYLDWLVEGGIAAMEKGCILVMPHSPITDDDGSGEVYSAAPLPAREPTNGASDAV